MRSPSSLIFLVLLGVWAAYFVQYWIRRRDHLSTARSVEQFSAAMRVLERRAPIPRTDLSDPAPRTYAVHPARPTRPEVVVKRAAAAEGGSVRPVSAAPRPRTAPVVHQGAPRRVRALALLASFVVLLVTGPLAAFSVLAGWVPALAGIALLGAFGWVRAGVRAEQAARSARRRREAEEARRRASAPPAAGVVRRRPATARPASGAPAASRPVREAEPAARPDVSDEVAPTVQDADVEAPVVAAPAAEADPQPVRTPEPVAEVAPEPEPQLEYVHLVDEDDIPLTWEPVPVPRPTYTMKAKAERPAVAPAATAPDAAPVEAPTREDALQQRRAAGA
ncbi:hypothetical protein KMZ32_08420 [Phycicoccus sp. MAQZ13P-2]|uniref:hypothetical protein n=1 Tax=Phycicoccus mangrovi TaxID=2840470 RepID=UPI001C000954|nr:hypothetical protein [Phycicoccus mangrovi]MBT9255111.1 hypothetical protein [Phycicoccus mangrovi]MBT9274095.1 hypothetical protein [Phycicoccus mangrovi]